MTQKTVSPGITGIGIITPFGKSAKHLFESVAQNQSCIVNGLGEITSNIINTITTNNPQIQINKALKMATYAGQEALKMANWNDLTEEDGFILATTTGLINSWEQDVSMYLSGKQSEEEFYTKFKSEPLGVFLETLSSNLNLLKCQKTVVTTACSASTQAIALASDWIKSGKVKRCLVGGVEVLSILTTRGFDCLQLLSKTITSPFDKNRSGINLSEGSAFITLEKKPKNPIAYIRGTGYTCDAYHMTAPHPEGDGLIRALNFALGEANLLPKDIDWIHAHGTGSTHNDLAETNAIYTIWKDKEVPVSSTKAIHGHALAASGIMETIIDIMALEKNFIPCTFNLKEIDPEIKLQNTLIQKHINQPINNIVKCTLGFGGVNACLILGRKPT